MCVVRPVVLDKQEKGMLEQIARGRSLPARLVERARIVLRAASGMQDQQIASELAITPEKAARWRNRYWRDRRTRKRCVTPRQTTHHHRCPHRKGPSTLPTGVHAQWPRLQD